MANDQTVKDCPDAPSLSGQSLQIGLTNKPLALTTFSPYNPHLLTGSPGPKACRGDSKKALPQGKNRK
jgi:hypothetical protein